MDAMQTTEAGRIFGSRIPRSRAMALSENRSIAIPAIPIAWRRSRLLRYGFAVLIVAGAAALRHALETRYGPLPPYILFYPSVMLVAIVGNATPGIFATVLSAAYAAVFLLQPAGQMRIGNVSDMIGLVVFATMGVLISLMAGAVYRSRQRDQLRSQEVLRDIEDRFRNVVEGVEDYAIFMLDLQGRVVSWNIGAERIMGWSTSGVLGQDFAVFFPAEAVNSGRPGEQLKIASAQDKFRGVSERLRKNGSRFWADEVITARRDDQAHLTGYTVVTRDISERRQAVQDMAESRSRLESIVESAMDAIITVDSDHHVVLFNAGAVAMFGCPATDALGQPLDRFIPQRFRQAHAGHIRDFSATGITSRAMGKLGTLSGLRTNGDEFDLEASISHTDVNGRRFFTVIVRDITDRKRAEQRQSLLLGELLHRVKNTLAVVQSIAAQTRRFAPPETFHDTFEGRLAALSAAHDLLTRSEWDGAALADVVSLVFTPYAVPGAVEQWAIEGPRIWLAPNEAVTMSLIFHELATNAAKYGALSDGKGKIVVRWDLDAEVEPSTVTIQWIESGGPPVAPPSRRSFGSRLLDRAVRHELGGEVTLDFFPAGAECRLRIPLSPKVKVQR
jgi:PAS domain S-box-containing protein